MKRFILSLLFLSASLSHCFITVAVGQSDRNAWYKDSPGNEEVVLEISPEDIPRAMEVPLKNVEPFLSLSVEWTIEAVQGMENVLQVSFSTDGQHWTLPVELYREEHVTKPAPQHVSQLLFADKNTRWVRIELRPGIPAQPWLSNIRIHFYSPGASREGENPSAMSETSNEDHLHKQLACPCPHPPYQDREDWCPIGCPTDATPVYTDVTHLIVHHSAGSNTSNDWAARVRAIWNYHVNSNGWDDIGYNWLIDPNGVLYEGRGDNLQGAHFCGYNSGTMGVCVMGTYTDVLPTEAAINTLKELLAWKSCKENIDPEDFSFHNASGLNLYHISGHRDGCNTECPGNAFYPTLPSLREDVATYIASCPQMAAPLNLEAEALSGSEVALSWLDNSFAEEGFLIERSFQTEDNFTQVAVAAADAETFTDVVPQSGDYFYRIRAYNAMDTSAYSETAYVSVQSTGLFSGLSANENLKLYPNPLPQNGELYLSWTSDWRGRFSLQWLNLYGQSLSGSTDFYKSENTLTLPVKIPDKLSPGLYLLLLKTDEKVHVLQVAAGSGI